MQQQAKLGRPGRNQHKRLQQHETGQRGRRTGEGGRRTGWRSKEEGKQRGRSEARGDMSQAGGRKSKAGASGGLRWAGDGQKTRRTSGQVGTKARQH